MQIICPAGPDLQNEIGLYNIKRVEEDLYEAKLKKYTGNKANFPGVFLLQKRLREWDSFPEGYADLVKCLISELEKLLSE